MRFISPRRLMQSHPNGQALAAFARSRGVRNPLALPARPRATPRSPGYFPSHAVPAPRLKRAFFASLPLTNK